MGSPLSHYEIGNNYSATLILLKQVLQHINNAIRLNYFSWKLRETRSILCGYILRMNWVSSPLIYVYFLKDFTGFGVIVILFVYSILPYIVWDEVLKRQETLQSTETGLAEQRHSFFWDAIYNNNNIEQWINSPMLYIIIGGVVYYSCCCAVLRYFVVPCVIRTRILYYLLLIALVIILIADWV